MTNESTSYPSDLEHGHTNYWNSASEEEGISEAGREGNEEMKDGREEPGDAETCPATKGLLTEGLGLIPQGWLRLNCKQILSGLQIQKEIHIHLHRKTETCSWRISWSNYSNKDSCWLTILYRGKDSIFQWIFSSAADSQKEEPP